MGSVYRRFRNICQPYNEKEVNMPLIFIFAIGVICSSLCITFYAIHFIEIRRMNREWDEMVNEKERVRKIKFQTNGQPTSKEVVSDG